MAVKSIGPYEFEPKDKLENFHGNQLLYVGWDDHLFYAAPHAFPLPPDMPFGALLSEVLPGAYGAHPEWQKVDWSQAQWLKSGESWQPDPEKSLAENGLKHKDVIRFITPGLTGIKGSYS